MCSRSAAAVVACRDGAASVSTVVAGVVVLHDGAVVVFIDDRPLL
jgi:hypothetical protein